MWVDDFHIVAFTPPALLGVAILMLFSGKLWTNRAYQEKADEAKRWREAYEKERKARVTSDTQTAELLEVTKTTHNIIVAMFGTAERIRQTGAADVVPQTKD